MINIKRVANSGISKTEEGNYESTLTVYYHSDDENLLEVKSMIKSLYPRKYEELGGDKLDVAGKSMEFVLYESSEERLQDIITGIYKNESMTLLYSKSEFDSVKDFIETSIKWFNFGAMDAD